MSCRNPLRHEVRGPDDISGLPPSARVSIVVGGAIGTKLRRDVQELKHPRIDVLEMESRWRSHLYDFGSLTSTPRASPGQFLTSQIARRLHAWSFGLALQVLPLVKDDEAVYATGEDVGFPLAILLRALRRTGPRLIVRLEDLSYGRNVWRKTAYDVYTHLALKRIDHVVCRTNAHLQYLHSKMKVPMNKLVFVPESPDSTFFRPDFDADSSANERNTLDQPIVSAGLEMRDYPTLIRAVGDLPAKVVIAAGSPWSHDRYAEGAGQSLPANISVSTFSRLQMRDLYRRAAFVVVPVRPTLRACGMNVILEAWAMEKAVIATRTTGLLDYIREEENGLFVRPYDSSDMREKILHLLDHRQEARRLGTNGRRDIEERLNLDRYISSIESVLVSVLAS